MSGRGASDSNAGASLPRAVELRWFIHNTIAHPLLGITEALQAAAHWFHDWTTP